MPAPTLPLLWRALNTTLNTTRTTTLAATLITGIGSLAVSTAAQAQFSVVTATEYSSGTFGTDSRTTVTSLPFAIRYIKGPWTFRLGSSWLSITGDGSSVPVLGSTSDSNSSASNRAGSGSINLNSPSLVNTGSTRIRRTDAGFGDVVLSGIYNAFDNEKSGTALDLSGTIKFGTADASRGLGSGRNDYSVKASLYQDFGPRTAFLTLGHKVIGTAPGDPARSQHFGALGLSQRLEGRHTVGAALDFASASSSGLAKPLEFSLFYRYRFKEGTRLSLELTKGLSDASPSYAVAATMTVYLD